MIEAMAYLRVSGLGQTDGDGFPRQRAAIERYAAANGITIVEWYQEQVQGSRDSDERVGLTKLFVDAAERGVKVMVVEALHRFARDLMIQESILADINRRGMRLISAAEPDLCSDEPSRVLMRQIFGAFNQYERGMIVAKLRVARERIKARGERCEGRRPYGWYPGEAAGLDMIRAAGGQSPAAVARSLDAAGIRPRSGQQWATFVVSRIMERMKA